MERHLYKKPPKWWSPKLSRFWFHVCKPIRRQVQLKGQRVMDIEIRGLENLQKVMQEDAGVLITPNHSCHADPVIMYKAAEMLDEPFYFMSAWQVFGKSNFIRRFLLRTHGCFSVDREGADMKAFRQAVDILQTASNPLVLFPEGEIYHLNDMVTPFKDGAAGIAMTAAKRADRPVFAVPCAIKYCYTSDPTDELVEIMNRIEERIIWRPRPDMPLHERIYRLGEGLISLKEIEYLGHAQGGTLPERVTGLSHKILSDLEHRYSANPKDATIPERVKAVRREVITFLEENGLTDGRRQKLYIDLEDIFVVTQLFSYPGDYLGGKPSIERIAETIDKFEEDIFNTTAATVRATRRAVLTFAEAVPVERKRNGNNAVHDLTEKLETTVQSILDKTDVFKECQ